MYSVIESPQEPVQDNRALVAPGSLSGESVSFTGQPHPKQVQHLSPFPWVFFGSTPQICCSANLQDEPARSHQSLQHTCCFLHAVAGSLCSNNRTVESSLLTAVLVTSIHKRDNYSCVVSTTFKTRTLLSKPACSLGPSTTGSRIQNCCELSLHVDSFTLRTQERKVLYQF